MSSLAWDLGTFTKAADVPTCLSFAKDSFVRRGLSIFQPPAGYTTIGGRPDYSVIVQVTCVPNGGNTWIAVSAFSNDGSLAETMRNNVRADIVAEVLIDG
jgi:hypothetical protein